MTIVTQEIGRVTTRRSGTPKRRSLDALRERLDALDYGADPERAGRLRVLRGRYEGLVRNRAMAGTSFWQSEYDNLAYAICREEVAR